jgi:ferritin-like protein
VAEALAAGRRRFLARLAAAAGVAPPLVGLLGGRALALPRGEETDFSILDAAIALEHQAIALYGLGLQRSLFPQNLRRYAVEFRGDHEGHRDTQIAIAEERGGRPPAPLPDYDFGPTPAGDDFIRKALTIEVAAQEAYTALLSQIGTKDYMLSAAFILIDEVRHMTVWRRVLGLRIY